MKKKQSQIGTNYLEKIPYRTPDIVWTADENGIVTLQQENKGLANRIAQKLLKKPKISYIHLDELGSFVWQTADGEKNLLKIGEAVEEKFGESAAPIYERLAKYCEILHSYRFILFQDNI